MKKNNFYLILIGIALASATLFCGPPPPPEEEEMMLRPEMDSANQLRGDGFPTLEILYSELEEGVHYTIEPIPADLDRIKYGGHDFYYHTFNVKDNDTITLNGCDDADKVFTRQAPDFRFNTESTDVGDAKVFFIPDDQSRETFLILHQSGLSTGHYNCYAGSGSFEADDYPDDFEAPPVFTVNQPEIEYSVWIGSVHQDDEERDGLKFAITGTLYVSSAGARDPEKMRLSFKEGDDTETIDVNEEFEIFKPEPITVDIRGTNEEPLLGVVDTSYIAERGFLNIERKEDNSVLTEDYWNDTPTCSGWSTVLPSAIVNWPGNEGDDYVDETLRFYFVPADGNSEDDTLVVHYQIAEENNKGMTGWYCSSYDWIAQQNKSVQGGPLIEFGQLPPGTFKIWVAGNHGEPENPIAGRLYISRLNLFETTNPGELDPEQPTRTATLDVEGVDWDEFLLSTPVELITSDDVFLRVPDEGLALDDSDYLVNEGCSDLITTLPPEIKLKWPGGDLRIHYSASIEEYGIVVIDPSRTLSCAAEMYSYDRAEEGEYVIWIGAMEYGAEQEGTLYVTGCEDYDPKKPGENPCVEE